MKCLKCGNEQSIDNHDTMKCKMSLIRDKKLCPRTYNSDTYTCSCGNSETVCTESYGRCFKCHIEEEYENCPVRQLKSFEGKFEYYNSGICINFLGSKYN